jgi:putative transposase
VAHSSTVLAQLIKHVPRHVFENLAQQHHAGGALRATSRWDQFVAMSLGQLGARMSLRDIEANLRAQRSSLYHLGSQGIARNSLSRLNREQPHQLYERLFQTLYERCRTAAPKHGFRFKNPLYSIDSSLIDLSLQLFPWSKFALSKGALKLHVALDHRGYLPAFAVITDSHVADVAVGRSCRLPPGSIVVFDRGYCEYRWFNSLTSQGIFFVTRERQRTAARILNRHEVDRARGLTSDHIIALTSYRARSVGLAQLRRVRYRDPDGKHYSFLTNCFHLSASTIAASYKSRWQVELFFRWIKQNLRIKAFLGHSQNAILTQIWIALCLYLVLAYLKFCAKLGASLQQMLRLLSLHLFIRRNLLDLLNQRPPEPPPPLLQPALAFA